VPSVLGGPKLEAEKHKHEANLAAVREQANAMVIEAATPLHAVERALHESRERAAVIQRSATKLLRETADPRIEAKLGELVTRRGRLSRTLEAFAHRPPGVIQRDIDAAAGKCDDLERRQYQNEAGAVEGRLKHLQAEHAKAVELEKQCAEPRAELAQVEAEIARWEAAKLIADFRDFDPDADSDSNDG
jgi:chromosome segregation ATPase